MLILEVILLKRIVLLSWGVLLFAWLRDRFVSCWFHARVLPFRRSMDMLCSCWKARWWWNIWGWSWGLHWNSATTSTNSNRAGCDSRLTTVASAAMLLLSAPQKRGSIFAGYKTSVRFSTFPVHHRQERRSSHVCLSFIVVSAIHQRSPKYQKPPRCTEIQLWFSIDEAV